MICFDHFRPAATTLCGRKPQNKITKKVTIATAVIEETGDLDQRRMEFVGNQTAINKQKSSTVR